MFGEALIWIDEPPTVEFKDGICCVCLHSEGATINLRCTPGTLIAGIHAASRAYADFIDGSDAEVIQLRTG